MSDTPMTDAAIYPGQWTILATKAKAIERKLNARIGDLESTIRETLMENLHLADGDDCTLKRLKDAINFELPNE